MVMVTTSVLVGCAGITVGPRHQSTSSGPCASSRSEEIRAVPYGGDLIELARFDRLPPVPPGHITPPVSPTATVFHTAEGFIARASVPDKAARLGLMKAEGFHGGVDAQFTGRRHVQEAKILRFRDGSAAVTYLRAQMANLCSKRWSVAQLPGHGGFVVIDPRQFGKAVFVLGDAVVTLSAYDEKDHDPEGLVTAWYHRFIDDLGTGPGKLIRADKPAPRNPGT